MHFKCFDGLYNVNIILYVYIYNKQQHTNIDVLH